MSFYKNIIRLFLFGLFQFAMAQTPSAQELVGIHALTGAQISAIADPIQGTLVYNTDTNTLQAFTGGEWKVAESLSTLVDNMDGTFTYTNELNESITLTTIGPPGPAGPKGDPGDPGPEGPAGDSANIIIDTFDSNNSYAINNNSYVKIQLNSIRINQGGVFTLANNELTVNEDGTYEIEYGVAVETIAEARVETKLQVNGVDLAASAAYDGGWYRKVTATRKLYVSLNEDDVISVWAQRAQYFNNSSNSVTTIENGSFLLVKKLD